MKIKVIIFILIFFVYCRGEKLPSDTGEIIKDALFNEISDEGEELIEIDTELSKNEVIAGEDVVVNCIVQSEKEYETEVVVEGKGIKIDGKKLLTQKAGEFNVSCKIKDKAIIDKSPAKLVVKPSDPFKLILLPKPKGEIFCSGDEVEIQGRVEDKFGNEIKGLEINPPSVVPNENIEKKEGKNVFKFKGEGIFIFLSSLKDYPELKAHLQIIVDCTPCKITIDYPPRGATLTGDVNVVVKGTAVEEISKPVIFTINDLPVNLTENGEWTFQISSSQGMNVIKAICEDGVQNKSKIVQSYYFSNKYYPLDTGNINDTMVSQGFIVYMSQQFFDDGKHDPSHLDDMATIAEVIFQNIDISSMIPQPVTVYEAPITKIKYKIYIKDITYDKPTINFTLIEGGLQIKVNIPNFKGKIEIKPECKNSTLCPPPSSGTIIIEKLVLNADIFISVGNDGKVKANVGKSLIKLQGLNVTPDDPLLKWLFDWLIDWFTNAFAGIIEQEMNKQLTKQIPKMIEDAMNQFSLDQDMEIKPPVGEGEPIILKVKSEIETIEFHPTGGLLKLRASITTEKKINKNPLGSIARGGCLKGESQSIVMPSTHEFEMAVFDDVINEAIFSFWWGKMFNLSLKEKDLKGIDLSQYGITDFNIDTEFYLPPIVTSCIKEDKLFLQLGDIFLNTKFKLVGIDTNFALYTSVETQANLAVKQGEKGAEIGFEVGEISKVEMQFVNISENFKGQEEILEGLIKDFLLAELLKNIGGKALGGFPIPSIDLSKLDPKIPAGTSITIEPEEIFRDGGYIILAGKIK